MIEELIANSQVRRLRPALKAGKVVLTCHVRPDGDAVGSTLALMHLLRKEGVQAHVITPDTPPRVLSFLPGFQEVIPFSRYQDYARRLIDDAELLICCDFNTPRRLSELEPLVTASKARKVVFDHHEEPEDFADVLVSYPDMSSTCEVVFRVLCALGKFEELASNLEAATCLTTGIITDTRNLSVNTKNLDLYDIVKELLAMGVNKRLILRETLETKSESALKLTSFALCERLKVFPKHRAALVWLTQEDLERFKYEKGDTEGLVNQALELRGIIYAVFMRQEKGKVRLSMRSLGSFPVSKICSDHFGGGGHIQAAGGDYEGPVEDCLAFMESILPDYDVEAERAAARLKEQGYTFD